MEISIFSQYFSWLFDGDLKSHPPADVIKPNSPISNLYIVSSFLLHGKLNSYLNTYFNNFNLSSIDKEELMMFMKRAIKDLKVARKHISYIPWKKTDTMTNELKKRLPEVKEFEIPLLVDIIEKSEDRDSIYSALGLDKLKTTREKGKKKVVEKKASNKKITVEEFLKKNFSWISK